MSRKSNDKGAVLLTTLLVMSLMSALAVAMMNDIRLAILRAGNIEAHSQANWYVKAAEEFAASYITDNFLTLSEDEQNTALKSPLVSSLPLDGGLLNITVMDGSQCFPLSALRNSGDEADERPGKSAKVFSRLLTSIGISDLDAQNLTAAIIDWQDEDQTLLPGGAEDYTYLGLTPPYRTPNALFNSTAELRAVRGVNEKMFQAISPFICTGDETRTGAVNINTINQLHLPILTAMLDNDDNLAMEVLSKRPSGGYKDITAELETAGVDATRVKNEDFFTKPEYLWIEADIEFGNASRTVLLEFKIDSGSLTRTYRHYGTEGSRTAYFEKPEQGELEQR